MITKRKSAISVYMQQQNYDQPRCVSTMVYAPLNEDHVVTIGAYSDYILPNSAHNDTQSIFGNNYDFRHSIKNTFIDLSSHCDKEAIIVTAEGPNENIDIFLFGCLIPVGISITDGKNNVITFNYGDIKKVYAQLDSYSKPQLVLSWQLNPHTNQMDYYDHIHNSYLLDKEYDFDVDFFDPYQPREQFLAMFGHEVCSDEITNDKK